MPGVISVEALRVLVLADLAKVSTHSLDASFPGFLWQVEAVGLDTEVGEAREELHHRPRERGKFVVIHVQDLQVDVVAEGVWNGSNLIVPDVQLGQPAHVPELNRDVGERVLGYVEDSEMLQVPDHWRDLRETILGQVQV